MRISTNGSQELPVYATLSENKRLPATQSAMFYYSTCYVLLLNLLCSITQSAMFYFSFCYVLFLILLFSITVQPTLRIVLRIVRCTIER